MKRNAIKLVNKISSMLALIGILMMLDNIARVMVLHQLSGINKQYIIAVVLVAISIPVQHVTKCKIEGKYNTQNNEKIEI